MTSNVLPHKDRNAINELSSAANGTGKRPPINHRDASGQNVWKNQTATAIPVPGQTQRRLPLSLDPYVPRTGPAFVPNRTASQTLTARRKRQTPSRIDIEDTAPHFVRAYGKSKGKQKAILAPQHDVVDVDEDEDLGQPLPLSSTHFAKSSSPDQLDCIQGRTTFRKPTELETQVQLPPIHPFDEMDNMVASSSSKAPHPWIQVSDPIEEFQPPPPLARRPATLGIVLKRVSEIDAQNPPLERSAPLLDLVKMEKPKAKDKMKPKGGLSKLLIQSVDPPTRGGLVRLRERSTLPVKRAFIGLKEYLEDEMCLTWSDSQLTLKICSTPPKSLALKLDRDIKHLTMSTFQPGETNPILLLYTYPPTNAAKSQQLDQFVRGDDDRGRILLVFEAEQPGFQIKHQILLQLSSKNLLNASEYLDPAGTRSLLERERRHFDALTRRHSSDGSKDPKRRRTMPATKPVSGIKRKMSSNEDEQVMRTETPPIGPPRKRSTYQSEDISITDDRSFEPSFEASGPIRRSTRQITRQVLMTDETPRQPRPDPDEIILVYPPNTTGAVTVKNSDLDRLQPGEFLNDTLIEFGLKLWLKDLEESHPELAKDVYVFSSFFYKKLKVRNVEDGYQSVRKWTSKFDIFQKKYIIVPINENLHWYLAIIYEPEHILLPPIAVPPRLTRKMGRRKPTHAPMNDLVLSKMPQTPEEDLAERTNEMLISPRNRSKTPSDLQEVEEQLAPQSEDELIGGGPIDGRTSSPLADMEDIQYVHGTSERARSLSASETGSRLILLDEDANMSDEELPIESQPSVESETNDIIIDEMLSVDPSPPLSNGVNVNKFYGKSSKGPITRFTTPPVSHDVDVQADVNVTPEVQMGDPQSPRTYIFTLDSLGTRHTAVYKTLNNYLKLEAKDKKDFDLTSEGLGMQALVPYQPNHCDCGVYLLHFAQTFMKDPMRYCNTIKHRRGAAYDLRQRQIDWDDASVGEYREKLAARIKELSVTWKRDKGVKKPDAEEGQAAPSTRASSSKTSPEAEVVSDSEDSDESIEFVGMGRVPGRSKARGTPKTKASSQASRLRG